MSVTNKVITKEIVIENGKLIIELVNFNVLTNTFVLKEKLVVKEDDTTWTRHYKSSYPVTLSNEEINELLAKTNPDFTKNDNEYIQNIKESLDNVLLFLMQEKPPYTLSKNSFEKY